jgi:signal transduction histidine kinase
MEIRKLSASLLPPGLDEIGLMESLKDLLKNFRELNAAEVHTEWTKFPEKKLSEKLKLTLYRIIQEHLNNISKHAMAKRVNIRLVKEDDTIQLMITDDGVGFDTAAKKKGVGLRNMISRAELNNGIIQIDSAPGRGCILTAKFPFPDNETRLEPK